jgi:centrosomal protein CEP76
MFWTADTGESFSQNKNHSLRTVGCLFNHKHFYGNIQATDLVESCSFNIHDASLWKELSPSSLSSIQTRNHHLLPLEKHIFHLQSESIQSNVESDLKKYILIYRQDHSLSCIWDDNLSYIQKQNVWRHEESKLFPCKETGVDVDFQSSILSGIPEGHVYKACPFTFNHFNPRKMFNSMIRNKSCRQIMLSRGDAVRLGVSAMIFMYGENSVSVGIMVSACFQTTL